MASNIDDSSLQGKLQVVSCLPHTYCKALCRYCHQTPVGQYTPWLPVSRAAYCRSCWAQVIMSWLSRQYSWQHEALLLHEIQQSVRREPCRTGAAAMTRQQGSSIWPERKGKTPEQALSTALSLFMVGMGYLIFGCLACQGGSCSSRGNSWACTRSRWAHAGTRRG